MKLTDPQSHQMCSCYAYASQTGFNVISLKKEARLPASDFSSNRLFYVHKGSVMACIEDKIALRIGEQQFVFRPIGEKIALTAEEDTELVVMSTLRIEMICSQVTLPYLEKAQKRPFKPIQNPVFQADKSIVRLFDSIIEYLSSGLRCMEMHRLKERELLLLLRANLTLEELGALFCPLFAQTTDFKARVLNFSRNAETVAELSQRMGLERAYFQKLFKRHFGVSPYQWMLQQKAEQTLESLRRRDLPLKSIAAELHFTSLSHLNQFCKKWFGKTAKTLQRDSYASITER